MKLKYYLKGIGVGIIITTAVFCIGGRGKAQSMTDSEIKARAAQLGMTEDKKLLAELAEEGEKTETVFSEEETVFTEKEAGQATGEPVAEESQDTEGPAESSEETGTAAEPEADIVDEVEQTGSGVAEEEEDNAGEDANNPREETVTVTIMSGDGSETVSKRVEAAGLVESASSFNSYLCDNGYSKRLVAGSHRIPKGASNDEIARLLTSR